MTGGPHGDPSLRRLTKRSEFLRAGRGKRAGRPSFSLQAGMVDTPLPGVGFTVSKQVGNAPQRNRVKRRLRAVARACALSFQPRHDYVLVGRRDALNAPFDALLADLHGLIERVHSATPNRHRADGRRIKGP